MGKSKEQIINETVDHIKENGRAIRKCSTSQCVYQTDNKNGCAVGRCMNKEEYKEEFECKNVEELQNHLEMYENSTLDDVLKEDYRGHEIDFWMDLQELHDTSSHFEDDGQILSPSGEGYVESLIDIYGN